MKSCGNAFSAQLPLPSDAPDGQQWLNLQELAEVEVTSEADGYPVESAFNFGAGPGWRAASRGKQRIRLALISRSRSNACASSSMNPKSREPRNSRCDGPAALASP